ncbi:MAG TPA: VCBS repeat-containing protein, partial [Planctomycetota bacterium]|nr:VCBS repeat-containing protein [Planctomycetota bacterium]
QVFDSERHRLLPRVAPSQVAAGDLDGDGDQDLAALMGDTLRILWNDGEGRFAFDAWSAPAWYGSIAVGDIDGDGDLDLAIGQSWFIVYGPGKLFRNDGPLGFADVSSHWPSTNEAPHELRFLDFDGDGDLDLVSADGPNGAHEVGGPLPFNHLYLNNGAGIFADATAARMPNVPTGSRAVTTGDIDGDGDQDLVFAGNVCRVFVQGASGVALETPGRVPVLPAVSAYTDVELADADGDGDLDLFASSDQGVHVFANNGAGFFALAATLPDPFVQAMHVRDFDGDGRPDLLAVRGTILLFDVLPLQLWRNTPAGFVDVTPTWLEAAGIAPPSVHVFDADGDGDLDVWGHAAPQPVLWHNDGQGHLLQVATPVLSNVSLTVAAAADIDGDGDADVAGVESFSGYVDATQVFVATNDGGGPSAAPVVVVPRATNRRARCLSWVDVDQDGDLDLFVGTEGLGTGPNPQDLLLLNVAGTFVDVTATHMPVGGGAIGVAAGDIDGDGVTDLVTAGSISRLYRGNGSGGFVDAISVLPATPSQVSGVALLDFDQDGDLDVVQSLASWTGGGGLRVLRNDWPLPFVDVTASLALPPLQAWAVATIDIDRDGRRDLLVGNVSAGGNGLVLLRSVGAGFVDETALRVPPLTAMGSIAVLDFDGDGWDDVACRDRWGNSPQELRNDAGVLTALVGWMVFGQSLPLRPAAADFDGDGDQDLITGFGLLENRTRCLQNAAPPRLGAHGELVLHAHAGNGVDPQLAALLVAAAPANPPLTLGSLGVLRLDAATAMFHSLHAIATTGGEASVVYAVAANPALLGAAMFAQALFVHEPNPATWRLGNLVELRVRL